MLESLYIIFLASVFIQGIINIYLSLYIWEKPRRLDAIEAPKKQQKPKKTFSILIPARHEEKVIARTIRSIAHAHYPATLFEILIICETGDTETILKAEQTIQKENILNAHVLTFNGGPINKPRALNVGLRHAQGDLIAVFDAEDEVHPDIFHVANTLYLEKHYDVLQSGVQLMNYATKWFSVHNVLEYYFWFKSRMHFHTKVGVIPLGGNTVFIRKNKLLQVGGWNENCLTEDAEIGIKLSSIGAKVIAIYDPKYVTKEETPHSLLQFVKQRTRWNQGFIQVLRFGHWKSYKLFSQKVFAIYTLSFPIVQAGLFFLAPLIFISGIITHHPVWLSLLSFIPLLLLFIQLTINILALHEFINEQQLPQKKRAYVFLILTVIPYQLLLGIGAVRAFFREITGKNNWEKTVHTGLHRKSNLEIIIGPNFAL